ncbi:MAG TPA: putative quinol monooxygenase [Acidimicrobiia bacterium]|nr:putative quinol monooxygenase [Acidimicrobiia bacterium]
MLIVAGTLDLPPEHRAELLAAAEPLMRASQAEEGCHTYLMMPDPFDPGRVRIFERWESEDALAQHATRPHMAEFGAAIGGLGISGSDLTKYEIASAGPLR